MQKLITIGVIGFNVLALAAVAWYAHTGIETANNNVSSLRTAFFQNNLEEIANDEKYTECATRATTEYAESWDRQCWANNEKSDCLLGMFDRYQVEHDLHQDIIICLAQHK